MFFRVWGLFGIVLIVTPVLASKPFDYIYIDANEGNASGGHVAIRFDSDIYHYQYVDPGLIKLEKQAVNDFEFNYRFLENRSLYLNQLVVSDQTYTQIRDHFDFRFQTQKKHYSILTKLDREKSLLQFFSNQSVNDPQLLQLSGVGLFYDAQDFDGNSNLLPLVQIESDKGKDQTVLSEIKEKIRARYSDHYLDQQLQSIVKRIKHMPPTIWAEQSLNLPADQFPKNTYTFANRYLDAVTEWLALKVIQQQRPLRTDVYRTSDTDNFSLTSAQQASFHNFSNTLQENIVNLLKSSRPDKGHALLVNLGRLLVLKKSIRQRRLVVLDNVDKTSTTENINHPRYYKELLTLQQDAKKNLNHAKQQMVQHKHDREAIYSQIEWQSNRFLELNKAKQEHVAVHIYGMKRIPDKPLTLAKVLKTCSKSLQAAGSCKRTERRNRSLHGVNKNLEYRPSTNGNGEENLEQDLRPKLSSMQLKKELQDLQKFTMNYQSELDKLYHYDLLQRNCVTELFLTINQAVSSNLLSKKTDDKNVKLQSTERLGGYVSIDSGSPNFIPFISHQTVQNQYQISEQRILPSYRLQELQKLYSQENKVSVFFREGNIFSSTLYKTNPADSFFVFFTDNHILLRPLYGAINVLAGLSQSVLGLFSLPFDSGQRIQSGVSGLIMSLPELVFFNMRKGSFKYLPYNKMLAADDSITHKSKVENSLQPSRI